MTELQKLFLEEYEIKKMQTIEINFKEGQGGFSSLLFSKSASYKLNLGYRPQDVKIIFDVSEKKNHINNDEYRYNATFLIIPHGIKSSHIYRGVKREENLECGSISIYIDGEYVETILFGSCYIKWYENGTKTIHISQLKRKEMKNIIKYFENNDNIASVNKII